MTRVSRAAVWLGLLSWFLVAQSAWAVPVAGQGGYTIELVDEQGRALPTYVHEGTVYTLGVNGARYNIRVRNHTRRRIEAVVTVDGRDVISGQLGDFRQQRGYLVAPHSSLVIEGFRKSTETVATFRFSDPSASYSARMGSPEHVGIVGLAVFPERRAPRPSVVPRRPKSGGAPWGSRDQESSSSLGALEDSAPRARRGAGAPAASAESSGGAGEGLAGRSRRSKRRENRLGTEYGQEQGSRVISTRFVRAHHDDPSAVLTIRYDDREGLRARGIRVPPEPAEGPLAFPQNRFAPPPP